MEEARTNLIPYSLETVPRPGDREIRMRPMSPTINSRPRELAEKEKAHV